MDYGYEGGKFFGVLWGFLGVDTPIYRLALSENFIVYLL